MARSKSPKKKASAKKKDKKGSAKKKAKAKGRSKSPEKKVRFVSTRCFHSLIPNSPVADRSN